MKLYNNKLAPNPRRVRIFLAEKGIEVPMQEIDIVNGENLKPEFTALNPMACVPVLELDDGTPLAESVAICRYFEELHPEPPLLGVDARDRALVEMWNRRMEIELMLPVAHAFRHGHEYNRDRLRQIPEYAEQCRAAVGERLLWLDTELADRDYIAGDRMTIADITALVALDFGRVSKIRIAPQQDNLTRWYQKISSRPSAKA
jgi:glutathione S-transferase